MQIIEISQDVKLLHETESAALHTIQQHIIIINYAITSKHLIRPKFNGVYKKN